MQNVKVMRLKPEEAGQVSYELTSRKTLEEFSRKTGYLHFVNLRYLRVKLLKIIFLNGVLLIITSKVCLYIE